ncbi:hypothetical protein AK812_SmicGene13593 [Symbiodinium microadriaticum]|uniref:Secreted protein n=1 Tax=Symbiodinium microadriaticum TaxID=2951 RepID=A0A1Q9E7V1_SYMMI|nr:hypothetical protein AK812_SmicGene13593 [Symbiodinium microadriaticum]
MQFETFSLTLLFFLMMRKKSALHANFTARALGIVSHRGPSGEVLCAKGAKEPQKLLRRCGRGAQGFLSWQRSQLTPRQSPLWIE